MAILYFAILGTVHGLFSDTFLLFPQIVFPISKLFQAIIITISMKYISSVLYFFPLFVQFTNIMHDILYFITYIIWYDLDLWDITRPKTYHYVKKKRNQRTYGATQLLRRDFNVKAIIFTW